MGGERLAAAAVAAAAVAWRSPLDYSVLAFAADVVVVKSQDAPKPPERVVNELLSLRGHGTTDLALALRAAGDQLRRSRAGRRLTVLLSDCRATVPGDFEGAARQLDELVIVAPADDANDAEELAKRVGAKCFLLSGPAAFPALLGQLV
jgi:Mg-chelatase subunit ChlD